MRRFRIIFVCIMTIIMITTTYAFPEMMDGFNRKYETYNTRLDTCEICHTSDKPKKPACDEVCHNGKPVKQKDINLNPYGVAMKGNLDVDGMDKAFELLENLDSDKDGFTNIDEIRKLTFPGDKKDSPDTKIKAMSTISDSINSNSNSTNSNSTSIDLFDRIIKFILRD